MNIADILNADNSPETFQPRTRGYATSIPRSTISPTISESIPTNLGYQHSSHRFFQSSPKLSPAVDTQFANPGSLTNSGTGRQHQTILNSDYQGSESYTHPAAYALSVRSYNSVSNTTHAKPQHGKNTYTNGDYRSSQDLDTRQSRDPDQIQRNISLATLASLATSRDSKDPSAAQQPSNQTPVDGSCYSWNSTTAVSRKLTSFSHARGDHESAQLRDYVRNQHESLSPRTRTNDVDALLRPDSSGHEQPMTSGSHVNTPELSRREAVTGISTGPISIPGTSVLQLNLPESLQGVSLASPISPVTESSSATAPEAGTKADNNGRLYPCSYTENCETKSPLRKVVSHFFGRNKLATRKIPKHLWVYFCRKHYQRSRYRNPKGFASLQIDLVMSQIDNLKRWGGVQDWTVKVRRREEIRQTKFTTADPDDEDADIDEMEDACDEEAVEDVGEHSRRSSSATAASPRRRYSGVVGGSIPEHYLEFVGDHKSMDQVIALVEKIRNDMQSNGGTFPDLELLPNVAANIPGGEGEGDDDAEKTKGRKSKGKAKAVVNRKRKSANISDDQTLATLAIISGCASVVKSGNSSNEASEEHDDTANPGTGGSDNSHKRSRVHSLDFADIAKNGTDKSGHNQQTATPPPSAPAASRRTSLAVDPGFASPRNTNDMVLRGVDAALKSVRSDETGRSIETARTSITEDGPDFRVTRPEAFGASNPASGAPSSQCAPIAETRVEGRCEVKREGRDYISTVHQPNETILQRSSGQFRRPEGVFECITVGRR